MPDTINLDTLKVARAFNEEAGKLKDGEHSRFLPGFTDIRIVQGGLTAPGAFASEWDTYYLATRLRDGKVYGLVNHEFSDSWSGPNPFNIYRGVPSEPKIEFVEMEAKTVTVTYYQPVK